ncbi:hypothetical protein B4V02_25625 [Paenibacillus kribbensis]|uniref:Transposase n=1 Tax=Paenibacillus kribbensis TaxID=172713 RepID=A0A222WVK4_9BACL|nr:hypothetical protein B4V02_25625 [Paenibacillus kribbensis]
MLDATNNGGAVFLSKFSLGQKLEVIHRYQTGNEGVKSIAESLGVHHEVLRMWIKQCEYHGINRIERKCRADRDA